MGGAQPLAAVMAGACCLAVEVDETRIDFRIRTRYLDAKAKTLDEALALIADWTAKGEAKSVGLLGNAAEVFPELLRRGVRPDIVTDQTSAHDPLHGYCPAGWTVADWRARQETDPQAVETAARASMRAHVEAMVGFWNAGVPTLDYGNNIRQVAKEEGFDNAFAFPGFVPAYIRPLFCKGIGPFRWCALSGDPSDIAKTDAAMKRLFPDNAHLHRWLDMAADRIAFQGLPARICWIGLGDRHRAGLMFNEMVASGELKAPIVIGRDHLDSGSVASPNRETEAMKDGSDAVSDWPLLNALVNTASGATWVSLHHGGGVGMDFRSTPASSSSPTARPRPRDGWSVCCGTTRPRASGAMPTRGMTRRSNAPATTVCDCPQSLETDPRIFCPQISRGSGGWPPALPQPKDQRHALFPRPRPLPAALQPVQGLHRAAPDRLAVHRLNQGRGQPRPLQPVAEPDLRPADGDVRRQPICGRAAQAHRHQRRGDRLVRLEHVYLCLARGDEPDRHRMARGRG